ncbi:MAG: dTDP-glucose 4,6-dehydratase [candidate division Zixibacteria bacterium]|nr:dTDP-glucose 4,6-dehydratase [candidate division Zixibacteria bacterium]MCI0596398.1 dTDP-glucose 4,6-dehydratase [candidate division Zixibacteria bacterium]
MRVLVTGGAGFIGSNFVRQLLSSRPDVEIINFDKLTYAGNLENLSDIENNPGYRFVRGDVTVRTDLESLFKEKIGGIVHFAAESHVDRSLYSPLVFVETNVFGTGNLLDLALRHKVERFVHISTDEVYGSTASGKFSENSPLNPTSPYSASKASSDLLALAYFKSFGLPVVIDRCTNNFGPYQFPEKLIPLFVTNAMEDKPLPVYGDGLYVRDWLFVGDHCRAIEKMLFEGKPGEIYNVGGSNELTNLEITRRILARLKKPESLITHVADRPGHDRRYALDASKLEQELGWKPGPSLEQALDSTIDWYVANKSWWLKVKSREYQQYYQRHYGTRLPSGTGAV